MSRSITNCFVSNVEICAFMTRTCLGFIWHIICVHSVLSVLTTSSWKEHVSISWEQNVFFSSCTILALVSTSGCPVFSDLTTDCPVFSRLGFGISWFESCIHTKFAQSVLLWQLFNSFSILLSRTLLSWSPRTRVNFIAESNCVSTIFHDLCFWDDLWTMHL